VIDALLLLERLTIKIGMSFQTGIGE